MAQDQTTITAKNVGDTLTAAEFNDLNSTVNGNATDAEPRLFTLNDNYTNVDVRVTSLETTSTGILSYTTANLPISIGQNGTIAYDTDISELVYYKDGAWYRVTDNSFWVDNTPSNLWTPAQIGTSYWWDANDASTITENAGSVSAWSDKNQTSILTQGNVAIQPDVNTGSINGLTTISFNGTDSLIGDVLGFAEFSKFIVFDRTVHTGGNLVSNVGGSSDAMWSGGGTDKLQSFLDGNVLSSTTVINLEEVFLGCQIKDAVGFCELYIDGGLEGSHTNNITTGTQPIEIGTFFNSNGLSGELAEIVVLPTVASLSDRQLIEGYLAHKWGFDSKLDLAHPYKSAAPTI